jgi:hypothetical protein
VSAGKFACPKGWQVSAEVLCSWSGCRVLTVTALTNAEYLLGSVALGIDEYYMGVGEAPGM